MVHAYIITGFLGVGKSSLLTNTLKKHFTDKRVAIVVNEFGEIGVDQNILKNVHSDVIEISEGCICCQLSQEFETGVIEIIHKYNPDILFVETSGISEPFPIYLSLQNLGITVESVLCVCDVKNLAAYKDDATAKYQIGGANVLILNKTDLVSSEELANAKEEIIALKEENDIKNMLTGKRVFSNYLLHSAQHGIVPKEVFEGVYQLEELQVIADAYYKDRPDSHLHLNRIAGHLDADITYAQLDDLLQNAPNNIIRIKGMVRLSDVPNTLIVNHSFGNASFDELHDYKGESILVLIGDNILESAQTLTEQFSYFHIHPEHTHHEHHHEHGHEHHHTH